MTNSKTRIIPTVDNNKMTSALLNNSTASEAIPAGPVHDTSIPSSILGPTSFLIDLTKLFRFLLSSSPGNVRGTKNVLPSSERNVARIFRWKFRQWDYFHFT